jgi:hypothetical protein
VLKSLVFKKKLRLAAAYPTARLAQQQQWHRGSIAEKPIE